MTRTTSARHLNVDAATSFWVSRRWRRITSPHICGYSASAPGDWRRPSLSARREEQRCGLVAAMASTSTMLWSRPRARGQTPRQGLIGAKLLGQFVIVETCNGLIGDGLRDAPLVAFVGVRVKSPLECAARARDAESCARPRPNSAAEAMLGRLATDVAPVCRVSRSTRATPAIFCRCRRAPSSGFSSRRVSVTAIEVFFRRARCPTFAVDVRDAPVLSVASGG